MSALRPPSLKSGGWQTDLAASPSQVRGLPAREPVLAPRIVGWRMAGNWGCECVTADNRGRLWLWRLEESSWVNWRGESLNGVGRGAAAMFSRDPVALMVPVYGPMPRTRPKPGEDEHAIREALDASMEGGDD